MKHVRLEKPHVRALKHAARSGDIFNRDDAITLRAIAGRNPSLLIITWPAPTCEPRPFCHVELTAKGRKVVERHGAMQ